MYQDVMDLLAESQEFVDMATAAALLLAFFSFMALLAIAVVAQLKSSARSVSTLLAFLACVVWHACAMLLAVQGLLLHSQLTIVIDHFIHSQHLKNLLTEISQS
jgi:hypothetical protein